MAPKGAIAFASDLPNDEHTPETPAHELIGIIHPPILDTFSPKQRAKYICAAAIAYNQKRVHRPLVLVKETATELEFIFYPNAANQFRPSAPPSVGTSLPKTKTDINLADLKDTTLPDDARQAQASFKFHKDNGMLTVNTIYLNAEQTKNSIKAGLELMTQTCLKKLLPGATITLSLDTPTHMAEVGAKALVEFLQSHESTQVSHLDLHHNPDCTESLLKQLAKLSAHNPTLCSKIQTLLSNANGTSNSEEEFFRAETERHTDPTHQVPNFSDFQKASTVIPTAPPPEMFQPHNDPLPLEDTDEDNPS